MRLAKRFSICNSVAHLMILSLVFACVGCSSKTDQAEQEDQMSPSQAASGQQAQAALKEQVKRLRQENEELKRALAESLTLKEELEKLKRENDKLKRVATGTLPYSKLILEPFSIKYIKPPVINSSIPSLSTSPKKKL